MLVDLALMLFITSTVEESVWRLPWNINCPTV